jgi:hypothetical protein
VQSLEYLIDLTVLTTALLPAVDNTDVVAPEMDVGTGR